jgi:hypothetical protein
MATADTGNTNKKTGFDTFGVVMLGLAVLTFVYALSLFLQGGFLASREIEKETKLLGPVDTEVQDALAEQNAMLLEGYRWIDKEQGKVGMPIEDAKALLVRQEARKESSN